LRKALGEYEFNGFVMQGQQQSKNLSNASLSSAKLTTSGEDAGENIMAATPACRPAKRIPEQ
jgi:hypothetical protein